MNAMNTPADRTAKRISAFELARIAPRTGKLSPQTATQPREPADRTARRV